MSFSWMSILLLFLASCGQNEEMTTKAVPLELSSMQELFNGKTVAETDYPAVYKIGGCTGTFVSPSTMITAAHCVSTGGTVTLQRRLVGVSSVRVVRNPRYGQLGLNDTAVVLFPPNTSPYYVDVSKSAVQAGDAVTAVGYGCTNGGGSGGVKRAGTNTISSTANGTISLYRSTTAPESGQSVTLCPGDSGGPLFKDSTLVGVASFWDGGAGRRSGHANVTHSSNIAFFESMISSIGADIRFAE
jgi:V8-like Glu-specific endopeptidase